MKKKANKTSASYTKSTKKAMSVVARWNAELQDAIKNSPRYPSARSLHRAILG